jgi:hypothetical protein
LCICSSGKEGGSRGKWFNKLGEGINGRINDEDSEDDEMYGEEERPRKRIKEDIEIEAVLHETLEAVVGVARTEKLAGFLKGCEYRGESVEADSPVSTKLICSHGERIYLILFRILCSRQRQSPSTTCDLDFPLQTLRFESL